jgi:hypothetical protein
MDDVIAGPIEKPASKFIGQTSWERSKLSFQPSSIRSMLPKSSVKQQTPRCPPCTIIIRALSPLRSRRRTTPSLFYRCPSFGSANQGCYPICGSVPEPKGRRRVELSRMCEIAGRAFNKRRRQAGRDPPPFSDVRLMKPWGDKRPRPLVPAKAQPWPRCQN